jgi:hypothetical protein
MILEPICFGKESHALNIEGMEVFRQLQVTGNPECTVCGFGKTYPMSALPWIFGEGTKVTPEKFSNIEDQTETWKPTKTLGQEITAQIHKQLRVIMFPQTVTIYPLHE